MPHETEQLACDFMYVHDEIDVYKRQDLYRRKGQLPS